jgi:hypothetical protein
MHSIIGHISLMSTTRPEQIQINLNTSQERDGQIVESLIWIDGWTEHRIRSPCRIVGGAGTAADQAAVRGMRPPPCRVSRPRSRGPPRGHRQLRYAYIGIQIFVSKYSAMKTGVRSPLSLSASRSPSSSHDPLTHCHTCTISWISVLMRSLSPSLGSTVISQPLSPSSSWHVP